MKLTKTIQNDFVNAVLSGEVKTYDFAGRLDEIWRGMIVQVMPVAISEIYKNEATRGWVNPSRIEDTRLYIINTYKNSSTRTVFTAGFEAIDRVEVERAEHYRNVDSIRDAITQVCNSVTTVMGIAKMLPQYSKYLPKVAPRPSRSQAKMAAEKASTAVTVANVAGWRAAPKKSARTRRTDTTALPATPTKRSSRKQTSRG